MRGIRGGLKMEGREEGMNGWAGGSFSPDESIDGFLQ